MSLDFAGDPRAKSTLDDPDHWLFRAEEMRTIAEGMRHAPARNAMLRNAACYERIAEFVRRYPKSRP